MSSTQRIRDAFDRMQHVFAERPAVAQATATMRARIIDGLHCEAREGDWLLSLDLPADAGGPMRVRPQACMVGLPSPVVWP